jgi:hypothetical protein
VRSDSTADHMQVLRSYLECNGQPVAFYTDTMLRTSDILEVKSSF